MITSVRLQHYRSYADESFEFTPGVNIIVGPNASGKTNLLESIQLLCVGRSYRAKDMELIEYDQPWARLDGLSPTGSRVIKIIRQGETTKKEYVINDAKLQRLLLPKTIPVVLFEPNHLLLLSGGPELRREYLDELLEQTMVGYATLRRQYKRALAQRNALLKYEILRQDQLFAWNIRLSQLGGQVAEARLRLVGELASEVSDLYRRLSKTESTVTLSYMSGCNIEQYSSDLLHKLEQNQTVDIERGFTAYGPHRDDVRFVLNDHIAQDTASRGETRTLLLVLKILELKLLERERAQRPLLLLDDVFSELDGSRRRALTQVLSDYQTFITTTDADMVIEYFDESTIIPINK